MLLYTCMYVVPLCIGMYVGTCVGKYAYLGMYA